MDNTIKPPGGFGPFTDPASQNPVEGKRETGFQEIKDKLQSSGTSQIGLGVVASFHKVELQDPAKLDGMVRASISELIDSSQNLTGPLSGPEKQSLVEFLSEDPIVRRQVESYLRKVLS